MKKSTVVAALIVAACIGLVVGAQYLDLVGLFKRMHGM